MVCITLGYALGLAAKHYRRGRFSEEHKHRRIEEIRRMYVQHVPSGDASVNVLIPEYPLHSPHDKDIGL
jgi:hypothetical protein